jgi:hypothetical protein
MRAQRGGGLLELGAELLHHPIVIGRPRQSLRRTLRAVLRLTGLPTPSRYPRDRATHRGPHRDRLQRGRAAQIDVDLGLLGPVDDLEAVVLGLLAKLQAQGYDATWHRGEGDPAA